MVITETIARRTDIKWNEKAVLAAYASVNNEETPIIDIMASMLGMDVQAFKRARKSLKEKGLLIVNGHSVKAETGTNNQPGRAAQVQIEGLGTLTISFNDLTAGNTLITDTKIEAKTETDTSQTTDSDLDGFYASFGKFLANVPEMGISEMKDTFSKYKANLEKRINGAELDRHIKKITDLFNEAKNLAMTTQPSHKVRTVSASFDTLVSKSFKMFEKYKVSEALSQTVKLRQMNSNLINITMESGQNIADAYFKIYLNTALAWNCPINKLVKKWNRYIYNERYKLVKIDGFSFV